ncbi:MAG: LPS assembly lipoprotein LptE [Bacteroidota bacterium]
MVLNRLPTLGYVLALLLWCQGCVIYSFRSSALSPKVKTFCIQPFRSVTALGPPGLAKSLTDKLTQELLHKFRLKQVDIGGDIQFAGTITNLKYTPVAAQANEKGQATTRTQLTITLELTYTNPHNKETGFTKKEFAQSADIEPAKLATEEMQLVDTVLTKLVKELLIASVDNW